MGDEICMGTIYEGVHVGGTCVGTISEGENVHIGSEMRSDIVWYC